MYVDMKRCVINTILSYVLDNNNNGGTNTNNGGTNTNNGGTSNTNNGGTSNTNNGNTNNGNTGTTGNSSKCILCYGEVHSLSAVIMGLYVFFC